MSASVGIEARSSGIVLVSPECMWHHQKTAFTRLSRLSPRWFLSMSRSREFTPPSIMLLVAGRGPALVSSGSR